MADETSPGRAPRIEASALLVVLVLGVFALGAACGRETSSGPSPEQSGAQQPSAAPPKPDGVVRFAAPARIVAVGDLHGDIEATRTVFRLAGAIDEKDNWIGGKLVLVQTGDQIDRGDDDRAIIDFMDRLVDRAARAGGAVHLLNGNHETMNVAGDFRYVTEGAFRAFDDIDSTGVSAPLLGRFASHERGRAAAFLPGGPYALTLSRRKVVVIVGDTLFVHGGVAPEHLSYGLDRLNRETSAWMRREGPAPRLIADENGPVWTRRYSEPLFGTDCPGLERTLKALSIARMVVGHTVQKLGVSSACNDRVWRIDVGLSAHYGGPIQALEIAGGKVRILNGERRPSVPVPSVPVPSVPVPNAPIPNAMVPSPP